MTLFFHNTNRPFQKFEPYPTFFHTSMEGAVAEATADPRLTTLAATITHHEKNVMPVHMLEEVAQHWWGQWFQHGMLDPNGGDFPKAKVTAFRRHLWTNWEGVLFRDSTFGSSKETISLLVFRPDRFMKLTHWLVPLPSHMLP